MRLDAMPDVLATLCAKLEIEIVPCNVRSGPRRTKAGNVLRRLLSERGEGHVIITLRTIIESDGNDTALTSPVIYGVSDLILAHPGWADRGLAWIEAFDEIDLLDLTAKAKANRKAVPARAAMAAMLYERLAPNFDPPKPRRRRPFKHSRTTARYALPPLA